jgi:hypothetical protein
MNMQMSKVKEIMAKKSMYIFTFVLFSVAFSRSPYIFTKGRFWAEEGAIYFRVMNSTENLISATTYYYSNQGYFSLFANLSNYFATFVPLLYSPIITAYLSLLVLLAVPLMAFHLPNNRGILLTKLESFKWSLVCMVLLVGPLAYPEVWANTINAQVYFGVISFLLLFYREPKNKFSKLFLSILPLFLSLSSPYSTAMGLGHLINLYFDRTRFRFKQALFATFGLFINAYLLFSAALDKTLDDDRSQIPSIFSIAKSFGHYTSTVLIGQNWGLELLGSLKEPNAMNISILVILTSLVLTTIHLCLKIVDYETKFLMIYGLIASFILVNVVGLGGSYAGRYSVTILGVILVSTLVGFLASLQQPKHKLISSFFFFILCTSILTGSKDFWSFKQDILKCQGCTSWENSVQKFESGETLLPIWPYPNWTMELP